MHRSALSLAALLLLAAPALHADSPGTVARRIAAAAGIDRFHLVEHVEFTFNARIDGQSVERSWVWWPRTRDVRFIPKDGTSVDYNRDALDASASDELKEADRKFVNDSYWLFFPFQVAWDDSVTLETIAPEDFTGDIRARGGLRVSYPETGGYTPGDVYELYYDRDFLVSEWVFRKGGGETPTRITAWKSYEAIGPLALSLDRPATDGSDFRIWFTDLAVKSTPDG